MNTRKYFGLTLLISTLFTNCHVFEDDPEEYALKRERELEKEKREDYMERLEDDYDDIERAHDMEQWKARGKARDSRWERWKKWEAERYEERWNALMR